MSKKFITFGILVVILTGFFITPLGVEAQSAFDECVKSGTDPRMCESLRGSAETGGASSIFSNWIVKPIFTSVASILMMLSSLILILSGWFFDMVVKYSVVEMAKHIGDSEGIGNSINVAWKTLRDIANMAFIFVLLYAAFKTMFDTNFSAFNTTVKNIIIIALLINFSLFFSKVVIDASNIVAVGFYKSIASESITLPLLPPPTNKIEGISPGYMKMLGMQTLYGSDVLNLKDSNDQTIKLDAGQILIFGVLGSVLMFIAAIILLIAGIMFTARFVILIFLMILSPIAFIAFIVPGMKKHFDDWQSSLVNQAFFAPLFFALTWVVFKLGNALITSIGQTGGQLSTISTDPKGALPLLVNYVLIIGFSIAALIFSKQIAMKGSAGTAFKSISGGIGATAVGGVALAGRQSVGRVSNAFLNSDKLRNAASSGKWYSGAARAGLWTSKKGAESSFDLSASEKLKKVPGLSGQLDVFGKAGGKGGFAESIKKKAEKKAKYAKDVYGQTEEEKEEETKRKTDYEKVAGEDGKIVKDTVKAEEEKIKAERKAEVAETKQIKTDAEKDLKEKENKLQQEKDARIAGIGNTEEEAKAKKELEESRRRFENITKAHAEATQKLEAKIEENDYSEATKTLMAEAEKRKMAWQEIKNIGTERQKKYAERMRGSSPVSTSTGAVAGGALGSLVLPGVGTFVGASIGAGVGSWLGGKLSDKWNWAGNKAAGRKIMEQVKQKSKAEKAADAAREYQKELDAQTEASGATSPTTASPSADSGTPPAGGGGTSPTNS